MRNRSVRKLLNILRPLHFASSHVFSNRLESLRKEFGKYFEIFAQFCILNFHASSMFQYVRHSPFCVSFHGLHYSCFMLSYFRQVCEKQFSASKSKFRIEDNGIEAYTGPCTYFESQNVCNFLYVLTMIGHAFFAFNITLCFCIRYTPLSSGFDEILVTKRQN